jgi:hypothetical protein
MPLEKIVLVKTGPALLKKENPKIIGEKNSPLTYEGEKNGKRIDPIGNKEFT